MSDWKIKIQLNNGSETVVSSNSKKSAQEIFDSIDQSLKKGGAYLRINAPKEIKCTLIKKSEICLVCLEGLKKC